MADHCVCWTVLNVLWRAVEDITSFRKKASLLCPVLSHSPDLFAHFVRAVVSSDSRVVLRERERETVQMILARPPYILSSREQ